ncbi:ATPase family AAA domain-containing protein 5 [Cyprinodon tularosa]|uniref:ATPase family AAA domain-containing protein 5 n=1 Tax=Cyprinodon tularosa TaxID=77115 RepID=UPI0018E216AA|nr:ATPase family AAA domain-containing protein 5 [Cyprinodon tularosa]
MAGVVAMASVIEDFDTQPCKKSRKDGSSPVVKTITNYFSPVPKPVEKPFSPPRSNNIMDYFSRKAPSSKEKSSPPQDLKENRQKSLSAEKQANTEVGKKSSEKRGRKASRAARKLVPTEAAVSNDDDSCYIVEETQESKDLTVAGCRGALGSDTAALLSKLEADACESGIPGICKTVCNKQMGKESPPESDPKFEKSGIPDSKLNTTSLSPKVEVKAVKKAPRKTRKIQQNETKHPEPEEQKAEKSPCDISEDKTSQLNSSTLTISFEDFVRSQNKTEKDDQGEEDGKNTGKVEEVNNEQMDIPKAEDAVCPLQVSPRTLTFKAEVHAVSPKQETTKAFGKLASIFTRRKGAVSPAESAPPPAEEGRLLPAASSATKRRSNVVLQEEDLELSVIESESTPKSSEAEKKQFIAAFKQPSLDGSKTKPAKSQSKQKQTEEKTAEEEDASGSPADRGSEDTKASKKKSAKQRRKKVKDTEEEIHSSPPAVKETQITAEEEPSNTSTPTVTALRRSRRETVVRKSPENPPTTPVRKTRRQNESKKAGNPPSPQESPKKMSTPKTPRSKHGVFVAEMVCPPDAKESPIRMRLSRVRKTAPASQTESGNHITTSSKSQILNESKKQKRAKKLVEKAKMIQQSRKTTEEEKVRRSSRIKTCSKKSYCEDEDSVVCIQDLTAISQSQPEKTKSQKTLRSLNEVLGKVTPPAPKTASLGQDKSARKVSAVTSIFDDSSREGSENSQDDEQFKARREFLKSGLPESFRKQIAKTAATKEAYSASSSSFQTVSHTTQPPDDCSLWSLPWPESTMLGHLKDLWSHGPKQPPSISGSLCVKTEPAGRKAYEKGSNCRSGISEGDRQLLMKEFCSTNPHFPAETVFSRLQKRRAEHHQQLTASEPAVVSKDVCPPVLNEAVRGKRKRKGDERENNVKVAKKQKSLHSEENTSTAEQEPPRRGGRTRRTQRLKTKEEEEEMKEKLKPTLNLCKDDSGVLVDDLKLESDTKRAEWVKEELPWTDKYQPQHSGDIVDNTPAVRRLYSWLKEWKLRADREERKNQKDKKQEEGSYDSEWDCGEEDYLDADDTLCNTMLITGPTGVGKTAAVYACAQELGFKVFEVNASSQRSGRLILSQLKEATQSHQVDSQGVNAYKPAYFNSYGSTSVRPGSSPRKVNSPRRVVSSPRKPPQSPRGAKKGGLAPTSLAKFFQVGKQANKEPDKLDQTAASKKAVKANQSSDKSKASMAKPSAASNPKEKSSEEQSKKMATSLILFEEVDVIFDDDSGFLAAIKTFMSTTKRPVILTTSDPAFSSMFDGNFEEVHFKKPSVLNVGSYLQLLCLAEDTRTHPLDIGALLKLNGCDIRQSLLQLQFWARSARGRPSSRHLVQTGSELKSKTKEAADESVIVPSSLPPCDSGCTESKLGLLNIEPDRDIWDLLRSGSLMDSSVCLELLTDSRRRGVDLLYSNMEHLLPLPLTQLSTSKPEGNPSVSQDLGSVSPKLLPSSPSLQADALPPGVGLLRSAESEDFSDSCSPVKVSSRMKRNKKHNLPRRDGFLFDSDSEDGFPSLCEKPSDPQTEDTKEKFVSVKRKPLTPEEKIKSIPVSQCLQSIADFWDNMSFVDSSLLFHPDGCNVYTGPSVSAVVKDGMTDESRIDTGRGSWSSRSRVLEIQATVEALSFHKCQATVKDAWDKIQQLDDDLRKEAAEELSLPVATHRENYSFTHDGLSHPQLAQRRTDIMEVLVSKVSGTLGNRQAAALDYLPALRTICRSEQLKEQGKVKRRFLHYLDAIHLGLEKGTLQFLAEDFR